MTYLKLPIIKHGGENHIFKLGVSILNIRKKEL
jgi:hypothetical protein